MQETITEKPKLDTKEIASIVSAVVQAYDQRSAEKPLSRKVTKRSKSKKATSKFSEKAQQVLKDYNKKKAHLNKHQKRTLIREVKKGEEITIKSAVYKDGAFKKLENATFTSKRGGIVIAVEHKQKGYTDEKYLWF